MAFRFFNFFLEFVGNEDLLVPQILVYVQPNNRYTQSVSIPLSTVVCLSGPQLTALPTGYDGFIVQRSTNNILWTDISSVIRDRFFYVDEPLTAGTYYYRARSRSISAVESSHGNVVQVLVESWPNREVSAVYDVTTSGTVQDILSASGVFPNGLDGAIHEGCSLSTGSMAGSFTTGSWYMQTQEFTVPQVYDHSPVCGAIDVAIGTTVMSFKIRDYPYPTGGSGINDSSIMITLAVTSQAGGAPLLIRNGLSQPFAPTITCLVANGVNPLLDRNVTITVPGGYLTSGDVVTITTSVADVNGNSTLDTCSFTMDITDITPPDITNIDPECGLGLSPVDTRRAPQNTPYSFHVTDTQTGINLSTLQVSYKLTTAGPPWTPILQNGTTWNGNFYGMVSSIPNGYAVQINRPVQDPLWPVDGVVYFFIEVEDGEGNYSSSICGFKVVDETQVLQIVPISESTILVEFTDDLIANQSLSQINNYQLIALDSSTQPVVVKNVTPQQFLPAVDSGQQPTEFNVGRPRALLIETSPMTSWGLYHFSYSGIQDVYGITLEDPTEISAFTRLGDRVLMSTGQNLNFRARRTKADSGEETMKDRTLSGVQGPTRALLQGLTYADEVIGGNYQASDWDDLNQ